MGHLERRITHQHIDSAEFSSGAVDYRSAVRRLGQVAAYEYTFAASVLNEAGHFGGVLVLVEIGDQHVGSFAGIGDGHRTTDTAVASCDHRTLTRQPTRAAVTVLAAVRNGIHCRLHAWNLLLLLWKPHSLCLSSNLCVALWLENDLDGAILLLLKDVVAVRCLIERQGVRREGVDAQRVVVCQQRHDVVDPFLHVGLTHP